MIPGSALRLVQLADRFESSLATLVRDQEEMAGTIRLSVPGATRFVFRSDSIEALAEAARSEAGPGAFARSDPRIADLIPVETVVKAPSQPCYLVWHGELRGQPHVRAAVAAIRAYFTENL